MMSADFSDSRESVIPKLFEHITEECEMYEIK